MRCSDCSVHATEALCTSCASHRADGHEPVFYDYEPSPARNARGRFTSSWGAVGTPLDSRTGGWCHGHGPNGGRPENEDKETAE